MIRHDFSDDSDFEQIAISVILKVVAAQIR